MKIQLSITLLLFALAINAQEIPAVYSNLSLNEDGNVVFTHEDKAYTSYYYEKYTLSNFVSTISADENGLSFDFDLPEFSGTMYYGLINYTDSKHPLPVIFKYNAKINSGKAYIDIKNQLGGRYDMIGWETSGHGTLGYRITDSIGNMLYEGRAAFKGKGPFAVSNAIIEGPFVDKITAQSASISLKTYAATEIEVLLNNKIYTSPENETYHEIKINDLEAFKVYTYSITIDGSSQQYSFKTAPSPGTRSKFTFAYASDSRSGPGGGERDMYGANYYIMKKMLALAYQQKAVFFQFTGDLINGYLPSLAETELQYANWKRAVEPWGHYLPIYEGIGNHESITFPFKTDSVGFGISIDRFPFETQSSEYIFSRNFVNPENGPESEDYAIYDPDPSKIDFPSYKETVFHYSYDNVAVICLNSDYWYAPSLFSISSTSGNLHGYLMDMQMDWLKKVLNEYEKNKNIDHIFVTQHTPAFPNGGHVHDDMWYNGNNEFRPWVAGKAVKYGILERRDQFLDAIINKNSKVVALLTGDEHNYCVTTISQEMPRYPESGYDKKHLELKRTIYQINNGAAGAPYYAQQTTPWTDFTRGFSTQNALVLIHVEGDKVDVEVLNPDTLEEIDRFNLRK